MSDGLDDFLNAPDSVRANASERQKYLDRKAKEDARREQERRRKSNERPSIEDLLADMVRVAEDEVTNPVWHEWRILSQRRYELYGHYPIEHLWREFGQFEHAKQVAGLVDKPGTRQWKAARAEESRREQAARHLERYVHPFVYDPTAREVRGTELILSISDTHSTFLDPFTWYAFLRAVQLLRPERIALNGDILEGGEISRYPKIPGWTVSLQVEFDFAREMFAQIRSVSQDSDLIWLGGNHGVDRLAMYLSQTAPALAGLRSMRFDQLAGLHDFDVKLAQGGTIASPEGTENDLPGLRVSPSYLIHHGTALGATPYLAELRTAGVSGQSGHVHRAGLAYSSNEAGGAISWMSTPMGCTPRAGRAYVKGRHTGWQKGFGVAFLHEGGRVHQYPVVTDGGVATFEGFVIEDPGFAEPDPKKLWLTAFGEEVGLSDGSF